MAGDVILDLANLGGIFAASPDDPLVPGFSLTSGVERAMAEVGAMPASQRRGGSLVLRLPAAEISAETASRAAAAIASYAAERRAKTALWLAGKRREGLQTLSIALLFIAVCILLTLAARSWLDGPGLLSVLARDGLVIAGWVALWRPIDMLLFETWLLRRERRVLDAVAAMPIVIEPRGD